MFSSSVVPFCTPGDIPDELGDIEHLLSVHFDHNELQGEHFSLEKRGDRSLGSRFCSKLAADSGDRLLLCVVLGHVNT